MAELTILWLLRQGSFSSGTSHCPPQEAEPQAKLLVMTPVGVKQDAGDPAESDSEEQEEIYKILAFHYLLLFKNTVTK